MFKLFVFLPVISAAVHVTSLGENNLNKFGVYVISD
jgi:hypothetical protein